MSSRRFLGRALVVLLGGAGLARLSASCADNGEQAPAALFDAGPQPDSALILPPPDTGVPPSPCKSGGWCVVAIPAKGVALNGIWGSGPSDVWLVGSPDLTLHWDGKAFASGKANTMHTLFGIWGSGASDVWTYSSGDAMWHSSGFVDGGPGWTAYDAGDAGPAWTGPVFGMTGKGPSDVWTVGLFSGDSLPSVWHCDGWRDGSPRWLGQPTGQGRDAVDPFSFNAIWGSGESELWVVGFAGKTRFAQPDKGAMTWTAVNSQTSIDLYAVWGTGSGDVWAVGAGGTIRRFVKNADGTRTATAVDSPTTATLYAITGFGPDDVWAVGSAGTLIHWDGKTWSLQHVAIPNQADADLYAVWGSGPKDLWVSGRNTLLYRGTSALPELGGNGP